MKTKVSFDIDGTLLDHFHGQNNPNKKEIQNLLIQLSQDENFSIYIITRRFGPEDADKGLKDEHTTVYNLLETLNITLPEEKVLFTNRKYKFSLINQLGIEIHLDDDIKEHQLIKRFTNGSFVDVQQPNWREKFDELL